MWELRNRLWTFATHLPFLDSQMWSGFIPKNSVTSPVHNMERKSTQNYLSQKHWVSPSQMEGLPCPVMDHFSLHTSIATRFRLMPQDMHLLVHVTRARPKALLQDNFTCWRCQIPQISELIFHYNWLMSVLLQWEHLWHQWVKKARAMEVIVLIKQ